MPLSGGRYSRALFRSSCSRRKTRVSTTINNNTEMEPSHNPQRLLALSRHNVRPQLRGRRFAVGLASTAFTLSLNPLILAFTLWTLVTAVTWGRIVPIHCLCYMCFCLYWVGYLTRGGSLSTKSRFRRFFLFYSQVRIVIYGGT